MTPEARIFRGKFAFGTIRVAYAPRVRNATGPRPENTISRPRTAAATPAAMRRARRARARAAGPPTHTRGRRRNAKATLATGVARNEGELQRPSPRQTPQAV